MALIPGTRFGSYEIAAQIGKGGMGEVYRALDTNLGRQVAIKILPDSFAQDPERLARFEREAKTLAALNHPHIAQIYGFEKADGSRALVLELIDGPTLAERIAQGPVPLDEALPIARQIAEALEAAHEQGIIHRDLKPANIKLRPDGTVKVLDFGLAKVLDSGESASPSLTNSPTITSPAMVSGIGVLLGTAAYMSPEQARGRAADRRSDMWAFGAVLYEMLTRRRAFEGDEVSDTLASVLKSDPDWRHLPASTPATIRTLIRRCLTKDPRRRLDSAGAARVEIEDAISAPDGGTSAAATTYRSVPTLAAAAIIGGAVAALLTFAILRTDSSVQQPSSRLAITPPPEQAPWRGPFDRSLTISPDGQHVVYTTQPGAGTGGQLLVRAIDKLDVTPLANVTRARAPFFSADSRWVGFFRDTELSKVPIAGGSAITLCAFSGAPRGASWGDDETIVFATSDPTTGLWRVPSRGGDVTTLTTPVQGEGDHLFPSVLPGGSVLFTIAAPGQADNSSIAILDPTTKRYRTLIRGGSQAEYVQTGHLIYAAAGTLRAVRFDLETLQVVGDPVPVLEPVRMAPTGAASYAISRTGTLVYLPGGANAEAARSLVWVDRQGREEPIEAPVRAYFVPRLSPDGTQVALEIRDEENDIWILELGPKGTLRKLTRGPSTDSNPVWTPDGKYLVFTSNREGPPRLYRQAADGTGTVEALAGETNVQYATSLTPDGNSIVGHRDGPTSFDIMLFPYMARTLSSGSLATRAQAQELVSTPYIEHNAELSPDGRYLAYQSNESGQYEVMVRPFPDVSRGVWTISSGGGTRPLWARSGRELFYRDEAGALIAVPIDTSRPTFSWGRPVELVAVRDPASAPDRNYDVSPDGQRFLFLKERSSASADINVFLNWTEELNRLVPAK